MNTRLHDDGLLALLPTVPRLAKLDLEEATEITNDVLEALTPSAREESDIQEVVKDEEETGSRLDHLIISFAGRLTSEAIQRLIEGCPRLRILEADVSTIPVPLFYSPTDIPPYPLSRTPRSPTQPLRSFFAKLLPASSTGPRSPSPTRESIPSHLPSSHLLNPSLLSSFHLISRVVTRTYIQEQHSQPTIRPRRGHRGWAFLPFHYTDASLVDDDNYSGPGRDECNNARVVLKSFWGWSLVDAIRGEEEAEKKRRRTMSLLKSGGNVSSGSGRTTTVGGGGRRLIGWRSGGGDEGGEGGTVTVPEGSWRNLNASTTGETNVPGGVAGGAHGAGSRRAGGAQVQCVVM
jgi:F-box and leucine-rich repeat protein 2/20